MDAGTYTASVTAGGATASVSFEIAQAENSVSGLTCGDITFGGTPSPSATAAFGADTIVYTYASTRDGTYSGWSATNGAGTWFVKASVAETSNYKGAEAVKDRPGRHHTSERHHSDAQAGEHSGGQRHNG